MRMSRFLRLWLILALALLVAAVFWPSSRVLGEQWLDFANLTYTHGWLIVLVCALLVVRVHAQLAAAPAKFWPTAAVLLAACVLAWLVAYRASIQDLHITLLPAIYWLAIAAAFGWPVARIMIFPVAFFYFAEPSWSQLSAPLQQLTVVATRLLLAITGPPALIAGDFIHIPNGTFEVQEGCSGLHFLIVGLAVAALHGELREDTLRTRIAQLTLMTILALVGNWVRVFVIIQVGYHTNMHSSLLPNHYWFGWGVFAVALTAFFWMRSHFDPPLPPLPPAPEATQRVPMRAEIGRCVLVGLLIIALPLVSFALRALQNPAGRSSEELGAAAAPWSARPVAESSSWQPLFAGESSEQRRAFVDPGGAMVETYVVTYREQRQGAKLLARGNSLSGATLQILSESSQSTPRGDFRESEVAERMPPHVISLIWSRYHTAGSEFASPLGAQLWYGAVATVARPTASLIAIRAVCRPDCVAARGVLQQFVASAHP
jgi:EpsI family protein